MRQLVYTMFIIDNPTSFHLRWKEKLLIYQIIWKHYEHSCMKNFLSLFKYLLTALLVKSKSYYGWDLLFIFLKNRRRPNLKGFQYQIWTSVKRWGKWLSSETNMSTFLHINCSYFRLKLCQRPWSYNTCQKKSNFEGSWVS